jgi:radical SAM superfamily enzyme YgiQ (UPF0313 family)
MCATITRQGSTIALADLSYLSKDDHGQALPLNIGYLGACLKKDIPQAKVELFKDPQKLYDALLEAPENYACLALSNYAWNFNLDRHFLQMAKLKNPDILTVMGGPNIDTCSDAETEALLRDLPGLDLYILGEGEYAFSRLMKSVRDGARDIELILQDMPGSVIGLDKTKRRMIRGSCDDDIAPCDLSTLPSPYLTGTLDEFLKDPRMVPVIETSRGCPYTCAYCCWGTAINSRVRPFDTDTVIEELRYISLKSKNPLKALYIADANFGILKRDIEIAHAIKAMNLRDGSHRNIYVFFAKNINDRTMEIAETLKELTDVAMSKQTLDPDVLEIIGRKNIPDKDYERALKDLKRIGVRVFCELIYGLPGESSESFLQGLEKMYQEGVAIAIYPLLLIKGSKINSRAFRKEYGIRSAFRIMPRYTGSFRDINSLEYEEILVSHSRLPESDFFRIRLIVFLHILFLQKMFLELKVYSHETRLNMASFFRFMIADRPCWPAILEGVIAGFEEHARQELIDQAHLRYDLTKEDMKKIRESAVDAHLYYFCTLIASPECVTSFKTYLSDALHRYALPACPGMNFNDLDDILDMCFDKIPDFTCLDATKTIDYPYDIDSWIDKKGTVSLSSFKTEIAMKYRFTMDDGIKTLLKRHFHESDNVGLGIYRARRNSMLPDATVYKRTPL